MMMPAGDERARDRARAAQRRRLRTHALALTHDDARLCDAVENAKELLAAVEPGMTGMPPAAVVSGALAMGEFEQARATIDAMFDEAVDAVRDSNKALVRACQAGRFHAWTGDAHAATSWLEPAVRAVEGIESDVTPLIARDLLALAEAHGDHAAASRLRPRMRGADPDRSADAALLRIAEDDRADRDGTVGTGPLPPRTATMLGHLLAGRTDAGIAGWTALAAKHAAEAGKPDGRAAECVGTDALMVPWVVAVGILGVDPDAARGRIRFRLHVPRAWPHWGATNIRVGDAFLEVRVSRGANSIEIHVEQTDGPLPMTLILEPVVHSAITAARVDGKPAELAVRNRGDAMVVPVQLVLDASRSLVLDLEHGGA